MFNTLVKNRQATAIENKRLILPMLSLLVLFLFSVPMIAQDEETQGTDRPITSTFESTWIIDNQTVDVPIKGTFEFDILHRFGTLQNGFSDFYGFYANSNIRLGMAYSPVDKLFIGVGMTKFKNLFDASAKYSILKQTRSDDTPLSVSYFGNVVLDSRDEDKRGEVFNTSDRYSFFHQILIARKFSDRISVQLAPSLSHYNIVNEVRSHDHIAISLGTQIGITESMDLIINVDQPITKHVRNNPNPNLSFGIQMSTSSHAFQIFLGNYNALVPQENNFYNSSNIGDSFNKNFRIGFNITRLWVY